MQKEAWKFWGKCLVISEWATPGTKYWVRFLMLRILVLCLHICPLFCFVEAIPPHPAYCTFVPERIPVCINACVYSCSSAEYSPVSQVLSGKPNQTWAWQLSESQRVSGLINVAASSMLKQEFGSTASAAVLSSAQPLLGSAEWCPHSAGSGSAW